MVIHEIDEIQAFEMAMSHAERTKISWMQPFWIDQRNGSWDIGASSEAIVSIDAKSGTIVVPENQDALRAFSAAKDYAAANRLVWKPSFTITWCDGCWSVGTSQSQFGGQCEIEFDDALNVVGHRVNPK